MKTLLGAGLLSLAVLSSPCFAQFDQYSEPGRFDEVRESTAERLAEAIKRAPWRFGRFYAEPWVELRDLAYIDNVRGTGEGRPAQSDITATFGAGLRVYRPLGPEAVFTVHALPQYVWWKDLSERSGFTGRFGAGVFGNFGRTGLEATVTRSEDSRFYSREVEVRANILDQVAALDLEVDLGRGIGFFAGGSFRDLSFPNRDDPALAGLNLDLLDREETLSRAGLLFNMGAGLTIGVGAESSVVEFDSRDAGLSRSNEGTSPILQLDLAGASTDVSAQLAWRNLEPRDGSSFLPYDGVTGRVQLVFRRDARLQPQVFASQNLVYSLDSRGSYFEETTYGAAIRASLGSRAKVRLFAETGTNAYAPISGLASDRRDDFDAIGASLTLSLGRLTLELSASRTEYDSNLPGFDRTFTVIRSGLGFEGRRQSPWA